MSIHWARNIAGLNLCDEHMKTIPFPKTELVIHVTTKTVQSGALLGTCFAAPIMTLAKGERDLEAYKRNALRCGHYGVAMGLVAGPILTWLRCRADDVTPASIWDRCYRLRYNRCQVRVDRLSLVGAIAGFAAAKHFGEGGELGALLGVSGGVLLAAAYNMVVA